MNNNAKLNPDNVNFNKLKYMAIMELKGMNISHKVC